MPTDKWTSSKWLVKCKECKTDKKYKGVIGLKTHYASMHRGIELITFKCEPCKKEWTTEWSQRAHNERHHSDDDEIEEEEELPIKSVITKGVAFNLFEDKKPKKIDVVEDEKLDQPKKEKTTTIAEDNRLREINNLKLKVSELRGENIIIHEENKDNKKTITKLNNHTVKQEEKIIELKAKLSELQPFEAKSKILTLKELNYRAVQRTEFPVGDGMAMFLIGIVNDLCEMLDIDNEIIPINVKFEIIYHAMNDRVPMIKEMLEGVVE